MLSLRHHQGTTLMLDAGAVRLGICSHPMILERVAKSGDAWGKAVRAR